MNQSSFQSFSKDMNYTNHYILYLDGGDVENLNILVVDDCEDTIMLIKLIAGKKLSQRNIPHTIHACCPDRGTIEDVSNCLAEKGLTFTDFDIAIVDICLSNNSENSEGEEVLKRIKTENDSCFLIGISKIIPSWRLVENNTPHDNFVSFSDSNTQYRCQLEEALLDALSQSVTVPQE